MIEKEIEELLGAYALDAVEPDERTEIEAHLAVCPRCRAEVTAHREVAALLANGSVAAPEGLWDKIADELSPELPELAVNSKHLLAGLPSSQHRGNKKSWTFIATMAAAAAVVLVIALLSVQVANLSRQVNPTGSSTGGIAAAVKSVLAHPHRTIVLTSARHNLNATVAIDADGNAYWVGSNLAKLPKSKTYQLWTLVRGAAVVSLGVLSSNPSASTAFRLEPDMSRLMVTVEPEGGTPAPTSPVLVSSTL